MGLFGLEMATKQKTIYALSTPPGKSAVAIIRLSGPLSYNLVKKMSSNMPKKTNIATLNNLLTRQKKIIDQTITTYFKSPKSYTGEDMVEISIHGSGAVIKKILSIFSEEKEIKLSKPGEFTRRAFENNKLDLTQVEAVSDIVNAETEMQRTQAINHLSGIFFEETKKMFFSLKKVLADIEASIDFGEEDLPLNLILKTKEQIKNTIAKIKKILKNSKTGISIRDGFLIPIIGKTNTGKSSFINNVSGRNMAIVTNIPGTTRDTIESFIDISGFPVKLLDTAGIRKSKNIVEKIGVKKALEASKSADINLVFIKNKKDISHCKDIPNPIFVMSKQDISKNKFKGVGFYNISSKDNYGIDSLLDLIAGKLMKKTNKENIHISRERHIKCLEETLFHLESSKIPKNTDIFAEDIRLALKNISSLFGGVDIEDMLDIIVSDFCIGK